MPDQGATCDSPVFVLTSSRSGSTLLRFILDSHPELACPPETVVSSACASLLRSWMILEEAGSEGKPLTDAGQVPAEGIAVVQSSIDRLFGAYLRRRGKRRWADKSLDNHLNADLLAQAYPKAKFICLYRHAMDVIASGVEACPWGVRYEDLVTAPEETAASMFDFLGLPQVPGITGDCFKIPHESNGPGDEKIWFTGQVTSSSIGRGVRVPSGALPEPMLAEINKALAQLGYRQVGPDWNDAVGSFDPRETAATLAVPPDATPSPATSQPAAASTLRALDERLSMRTDADLEVFAARWPALKADTFALVVDTGEPTERRWSLGDAGEPVATLIAGPGTWGSLLGGETNIVSELTAGRLRCINRRDRHRLRSEELHAMTWLLGLTQIPIERAPALAASEAG